MNKGVVTTWIRDHFFGSVLLWISRAPLAKDAMHTALYYFQQIETIIYLGQSDLLDIYASRFTW